MSERRLLALVAGVLLALGPGLAGCSDPEKEVRSGDATKRMQAIRTLAERGTEEDIQRIAEAAGHEDATTAREAVVALGRSRSPAAVKALANVAVADQRAGLRQMAVSSLAEYETPEAARALRQALQADEDACVRGEAAASLGRAGSLDDIEFLVGQLDRETDPVVQSRTVAAIESLIRLRFGYDPAAPPKERQEALRRVKAAVALARNLKNIRIERGVTP
jgi:HEAT repeat protein